MGRSVMAIGLYNPGIELEALKFLCREREREREELVVKALEVIIKGNSGRIALFRSTIDCH